MLMILAYIIIYVFRSDVSIEPLVSNSSVGLRMKFLKIKHSSKVTS